MPTLAESLLATTDEYLPEDTKGLVRRALEYAEEAQGTDAPLQEAVRGPSSTDGAVLGEHAARLDDAGPRPCSTT